MLYSNASCLPKGLCPPARASKALTEIIIPVYMYDIINIAQYSTIAIIYCGPCALIYLFIIFKIE